MNIVLIQERYFKKTLEDLGHKVFVWDEGHRYDTCVHVKTVLNEIPEINPGVILQMESLGNRIIIKGLEEVDILTAFYAIDIHLNYYWHKEYAKLFDIVLVSQKDYVPLLRRDGIQNAHWFPWAIDPNVFKDYELERNLDISFVGIVDEHNRPKRSHIIREISDRFDIHLFGTSISERIPQSEMAKIFSQSKIIVNESINREVNFRVFESMASGGLLLTEKVENGLDDMFIDGTHLVTYEPNNLPERIEYYLSHEDERERIAGNGKEQVQKYHTLMTRTKELVGILTDTIQKKRAFRKIKPYKNYGKTFFYTAQRGLLYLPQRGIEKAVVNFHKALEEEPCDPEILLYLGMIYMSLGEYEKAQWYLWRVREDEPDNFQIDILLGHLFWQTKDIEKAKLFFRAAFIAHGYHTDEQKEEWDGDPEDPRFYIFMGDIYRRKGKDYIPGFIPLYGGILPFSAMDYYTRGIKQDPHCADYFEKVGEIYFKWKVYDLAARYFNRAVAIDSSRARAWKYLGLSSLRCFEREKGIRALIQAYFLDPTDFLLSKIKAERADSIDVKEDLVGLSERLFDEGRFEDFIWCYKKAGSAD